MTQLRRPDAILRVFNDNVFRVISDEWDHKKENRQIIDDSFGYIRLTSKLLRMGSILYLYISSSLYTHPTNESFRAS
jgi:hypothetical protein